MKQTLIDAFIDRNIPFITKNLSPTCALKAPETALVFNPETIIDCLNNIEKVTVFSPYLSYYLLDIIYKGSPAIMKIRLKNEAFNAFYIEYREPQNKRIRLDIEYDGSFYHGFQRQNNCLTVQGTLEKALSKLLNKNITVHGASRTDARVHAEHQVVHFDTDSALDITKMHTLIDEHLPEDIKVQSLSEVPQVFHARYDALYKTYVYRIHHQKTPSMSRYRARYPHYAQAKIAALLQPIIGTHDFLSFSKADELKNTVRTIFDVKVSLHPQETVITITGDGFLRNMVRMIIGQLYEDLRRETSIIKIALENPSRNHVKYLASAEGLYLSRIIYEDVT